MSKTKQCWICRKTETKAEIAECERARDWARRLIDTMEAESYNPADDVVDPWEVHLDAPLDQTQHEHPSE